MPAAELIFQRTIDLPPVIVWDALVDPDLLAGWLGEVRMLPAAHADETDTEVLAFELRWPGSGAGQSTTATVSEIEAPRRLRVDTDNRGRIEFILGSIPGGFRGSSTELELRVDSGIEPAFATAVRGEWQTSLDRLERLLHGHPVDWAKVASHSDGTTGVGGTTARSVNSPG
ncbi:SRPBCC family protein [Glaciihabitans sp. INWT7]|uniref:SRPBCC family protein n=1 Tax=Glaciihabitans sp. INWT7 TaxID=2596912 RepID=UPI001627487E|nr:SRPBCC family protein [Glaciihabitans sp. INWT7]